MKKTLFISILSCLLIILISCQNEKQNVQQKVLGGKHILRKFNVKTTTTTSSSGSFFLVVGGYSSSTREKCMVRFYFLNYKGEYQLMEKYLTDVNIKIDSTVKQPYAKFYWTPRLRYDVSEYNSMYNYDVTRVVIYCKDEDFQPEININDLK